MHLFTSFPFHLILVATSSSVGRSTKISHSSSAIVFSLGGWKLAWRLQMCVCVHANWLKGGVAMGVTYCKKVLIFHMDLQTCTRCSGKVCHEAKDSWLTVRATGKKGGVAVGVAGNTKMHNFWMDSSSKAKLCRNTHTHTHILTGHGLSCSTLSSTPFYNSSNVCRRL